MTSYLPSVLADLVQSVAEMVVGPPAPFDKEPPPLPEREDETPKASKIVSAPADDAVSIPSTIKAFAFTAEPEQQQPIVEGPTEIPRVASPAPSTTSSTSSRQLSSNGEPFSDDPFVSAMQRIPDTPPPGTPERSNSVASFDMCSFCSSAGQSLPVTPQDEAKVCTCLSDTKHKSVHFHRLEQMVKGTKRISRQIKQAF